MRNIHLGVTVFALLLCSPLAHAHDTTHIHPMITERTATLLENTDTDNKYEEIYENDPNNSNLKLYWGLDHDNGRTLDLPYLVEDNLAAYTGYNTVMDGVVQEDAPVGKVLSHFFHATRGIELRLNGLSLGGNPSAETAMGYFHKAIGFYQGYTDEAKIWSYFTFGQSLHHVEDMSSPAHIHNDAHLTFSEEEKDDYEGWYLPTQKRFDGQLTSYFSPTTVRPVSNPWNDIWGVANTNSMVRFFYDRTTYQASLQFPTGVYDQELDYIVVDTPAPAAPTGELQQMFPCLDGGGVPDNTVPNCLHWVEDDLNVLAHWEINAVGDFQHQYDNGSSNDWWPLEMEYNPGQVIVETRPLSFGNQYYLEQLAHDGSKQNPLGSSQVIPTNMRSNFMVPGSPMAPNSEMILELRARNLLTPAVEFSAGFTRHWFDIANTPPYLKSVRARQAPQGETSPADVYHAYWSDHLQVRPDSHQLLDTCIFAGLTCETVFDSINVVDSRQFVLDPSALKHIHAANDLELELEFNEPIEAINLIGFGQFDAAGACVATTTCLDFTPPTDGSPTVYNSLVTPPEQKGRLWIFTLPGNVLQNLNGKVQLTVRAIDKNNHDDGEGGTQGAALDTTPATPARRDLAFGGTSYDPYRNYYPWYKDQGAEPGSSEAKYSYDPEDGDRNHVFLFDTLFPSAVINVDTTLPN